MRRTILAALAAAVALAGGLGLRPIIATPAAAQATASHLVVYIRLGPNWDRREGARPILLAHRDLYRGLAEQGEMVFSGRFDGEPTLGMAVFDAAADEGRIRRLLETDPAVTGGYLAVEFRRFAVTMGALRPARS